LPQYPALSLTTTLFDISVLNLLRRWLERVASSGCPFI